MLNQTILTNLQERFNEHWNATQFNNVVAFVQDEFSSNKLNHLTMFEAIHHTNIALNKYLEKIVNVKFASSFGKFISQAIIAATGVNVLQAYQDARDAKANRIVKQLENEHQWQVIDGIPTYTEEGKTFHLVWEDKGNVVQLQLGENKVFEMVVWGYGHEAVATRIDSAVYDAL